MSMEFAIKKYNNYIISLIFALFTLTFVVFSLCAIRYYPGSTLIYSTFCAVSFLLIPLAFIGNFSYFYFFMACFQLLGFWFKAVMLFALHTLLIEPIGLFSGLPAEWDKALIVATVGLTALLCAKIFFIFYDACFHKITVNKKPVQIPHWYKKYRALTWIVSISAVIALSLLNYNFDIYKVGIIPTLYLPFKLSALIPFLMNIGFSLWFATLVWWDVNLKKNVLSSLSIVIISSILMSSSILSRGLYLYQTTHYLVSLTKIKQKIKHFWKISFVFILILTLGMFLTLKVVMVQRNYLYPSLNEPQQPLSEHSLTLSAVMVQPSDLSPAVNEPQKQQTEPSLSMLLHISGNHPIFTSSGSSNIVKTLMTERWIGLEGVMAVSAWPDLNEQTLYNGWTQRLNKDSKNPYPAISQAIYFTKNYPEKDKFFFSSLPGLIAMADYSNSLLVVFSIVFFIGLIYICLERAINFCLYNPFINSFYGVYTAMLLAMLNDGHALAAQTLEMLIFILVLSVLQNRMVRCSRQSQNTSSQIT